VTKRNCLLAGGLLAPILLFYILLAREIINIPFLDDYSAVLGFLSEWSKLETVRQKTLDVLAWQHNEYKLILANALYVLQYLAFGRTNFAVLSVIGDLLMLPLVLIIYRMWAGDAWKVRERLLLFIPVPWLLFQLQYYSLMNWPVASLQHIPALLFSFLAIYLLARNEMRAFALSLLSLALGVSASGSGFLVAPIGCLILLQYRRPQRLLVWLSTSAALFAVYSYKYNRFSSQLGAGQSISTLHHISPLYAMSFLGASVARYGVYWPAAALGGCLVAAFLYAIVDRLYAANPAIFYSISLIILTSLAVSYVRSGFGLEQSLASRYRIYSNILLALIYLFGAGKLYNAGTTHPTRTFKGGPTVFATIMVFAVLFNIGSNYSGFGLLRARTELTREGLCRWERGQPPMTGAASDDPVIHRQLLNGNYSPEGRYLREAILLHIYIPPTRGVCFP
jgi:hypothetical protein